VVDEDDIRLLGGCDVTHFICLAAAHEEARVRPFAATGNRGHGLGTSGAGELRELLQIFRIDLCAKAEAHENGTLTAAWAFEHSQAP
jgi:hypothetical protein